MWSLPSPAKRHYWRFAFVLITLQILGTTGYAADHGPPPTACGAPATAMALAVLPPYAPYGPLDSERPLIVIDTRRHRLTVLLDGYPIRTFPVAAGTSRTPSPTGEWRIIQKEREWGGGFGSRWLGLDVPWGIYGIHGTNKPWLMNRNVSGGCIRMRNKDVEDLYELVSPGTIVTIFGDPVFYRPTLVEGHKGADVLQVQSLLFELGVYAGPLDGNFGPATARAVRRFQKQHGLPVTGIVRWETFRALGLQS